MKKQEPRPLKQAIAGLIDYRGYIPVGDLKIKPVYGIDKKTGYENVKLVLDGDTRQSLYPTLSYHIGEKGVGEIQVDKLTPAGDLFAFGLGGESSNYSFGEARSLNKATDQIKSALKQRVKGRKNIETSVSAFAILSGVGLIAGLFFLSGNLTGNVIGSLNKSSSNWIGGSLFVLGLVGAFCFLKRK